MEDTDDLYTRRRWEYRGRSPRRPEALASAPASSPAVGSGAGSGAGATAAAISLDLSDNGGVNRGRGLPSSLRPIGGFRSTTGSIRNTGHSSRLQGVLRLPLQLVEEPSGRGDDRPRPSVGPRRRMRPARRGQAAEKGYSAFPTRTASLAIASRPLLLRTRRPSNKRSRKVARNTPPGSDRADSTAPVVCCDYIPRIR